MPPTPITGTPTRSATRRVASTPIASNAGPLTPPDPLPRRACSIPGMVLTKLTASAPSCWATCAMAGMSGSTVESLITSGRVVTPRQRGHGFRDDPPQRVEIDDPVHLAAEGRRPGGEEHGILEARAKEAHGRRGGRRAHGASSVGPRRPGTGGLTVAATASGGERNSKPSARAREASAAAYAGLASPRTASVYGEVGYRLDSSATKESCDWGSNPAAATSPLGAKSELGASVTMRRNSRPASRALPSESRASSAARNSAAAPLASSTR